MSVSVLNTDANVSAKTLMVAEGAETVTGLKTFDRDPNAPFAVAAGSAVVPNLDADKLDGQDAPSGDIVGTSDTQTLTNKTLTSPSMTSPSVTSGALDLQSGQITFPSAQAASIDGNTLDDYEEGTWTPTWTGSTTNPSLGNGTISASYIKIGKMVMWSLDLTIGSTTTAGSGTWRFTLPFTAASSSASSIGSGHVTDSGTQHYVISAYLFSTTVMQIVQDGNTGAGIGSGVPFTWATNDAVHAHGVYIADQ